MRRRSALMVGVVAVVVGLQVAAVAGVVAALNRPSAGFLFHVRDSPIHVGALAITDAAVAATQGSPAHIVVRTINGRRVDGAPLGVERVEHAEGLLDLRPGAVNTFGLADYRGVALPPVRLEVGDARVRNLARGATVRVVLFPLVGLDFLLMGMWIWRRRRRDRASTPLLLFGAVASVNLMWVVPGGAVGGALGLVSAMALPLYGPAGLNVALRFTGLHGNERLVRVLRVAVWVAVALAIALGASWTAALRGYGGATTIFAPVMVTIGVLLAAEVVLMVGISIWAARPPNPIALRRRARVFAVISLIAFFPPSILVAASPLLNGGVQPPWMMVVTLVCLGSFPILLGYAIVRHQAFDLRIVIRRSVVYGGLSLVIIFVFVAGLLSVGKHLRLSAVPRPLIGLALAGFVVAFGLIQIRLQRVIDRWVYRSRYVYGRALAQASDALAHARSLDEVRETLRSALIDAMRLARGYFAIVDERDAAQLRVIYLGKATHVADAPPLPDPLPVERFSPIERALDEQALVSSSDMRAVAALSDCRCRYEVSDASQEEASFWQTFGIEVVAPVTLGRDADTRVLGLLLLGPKNGEQALDSEDHAMLTTLANQLAIAIENARAFDEISRLKQGLEVQVEERTRELSDALTEIQSAQGKLVETEKQAMLGRLVAGIVHEINTPLGALRSSVDTIERTFDRSRPFVQEHADDDARGAKQILRALDAGSGLTHAMRESSDRLAHVIESLKRFVNLDEANIKPVDVRQGIDDAVNLLGPVVQRGLRVVRRYPDTVPPVRAYPAKLNQVFLSVLHNAVAALGHKGEVRVTVEVEGEAVTIAFSDNGPGIPREKLDQLFDFGFTTKQGGRVGLRTGLPASKYSVEEIGGTLAIDSVEGEGTTVRVQLPAVA